LAHHRSYAVNEPLSITAAACGIGAAVADLPASPLPALIDAASLDAPAIPIRLVGTDAADLPPGAALNDFSGQAGRVLLTLTEAGPVALVGVGEAPATFAALRALPGKLPAGIYRFEEAAGEREAVAWALGAYGFERFKSAEPKPGARLAVSAQTLATAAPLAAASALARDLVNTPANAMGPAEIEAAVRAVAADHGAAVQVTTGEALRSGYPAVHAVGRAADSARAPRFIELSWSPAGAAADAPVLVLIGKGVAFDTGGLDLKPSAGMRWMKKDMGGAAHALALASLVMGAKLPVRLTLLVPAVENAVSGDAMRPGDVLDTRSGKTVEVGNTDAEGRLILADALTRAGELSPDLTIDLATLTGAARVALGPELPPFYTDDEALAAQLAEAAMATEDPLWRLPLWAAYDEALSSDVADMKNDADGWAQAGSVTAALFLKRFAPEHGAWLHLDIFAWNARGRPGHPTGAEAEAIRALFALLAKQYG
jgi:leucyl aminopeptidase